MEKGALRKELPKTMFNKNGEINRTKLKGLKDKVKRREAILRNKTKLTVREKDELNKLKVLNKRITFSINSDKRKK